MYRLLALGMLLLATGCAGERASPPAAAEPSDDHVTAVDASVELSVPQSGPQLEYPEKADVERLLVRASELESNGKFQDALAVANQAVAVDPSSPRANEMKARLEELLRRIRAAPAGDDHPNSSSVAQRTTP